MTITVPTLVPCPECGALGRPVTHLDGSPGVQAVPPDQPAYTGRRAVLTDGSIVEWMMWSWRKGVENVLTLDVVTNPGKVGSESRKCFYSLEELRREGRFIWADWQTIERTFNHG